MKKLMAALLVLALLVPLTSLATAGNEDRFPITEEKITLDIVRRSWSHVRPMSANDLWMWEKYEGMTNVNINWIEVPQESIKEKVNIMLATNDLPDAFYQIAFTPEEVVKYSSQGLFVPMNDLIESDGKSIQQLFEQDPSIKKTLTYPDGEIYTLPYVFYGESYLNNRYYINRTWLDKLNLAVPTTLDELTNALVMFKDEDPNGNGDGVPIYLSEGYYWQLRNILFGSFGLGNRGGYKQKEISYIDMGSDGKVRYIVFDPMYKEMLQYMNNWWEQGLFHPQQFSTIDYAKWASDGANDRVGLWVWVSPNYIGIPYNANYAGINGLVGPHGDALNAYISGPVDQASCFVITKANEHPHETMQWVDYMFTEEGSMFGYMGLEGETYTTDENGRVSYIDEIRNYEGGNQVGAFQWVDDNYGGGYPGLEVPPQIMSDALEYALDEDIRCAWDSYKNFVPDEIWPAFLPTVEENAELVALLTDLNTYVQEMEVKFITGEVSFDEWDSFIGQLDRMGANRYLEIKQQQYDRYSSY